MQPGIKNPRRGPRAGVRGLRGGPKSGGSPGGQKIDFLTDFSNFEKSCYFGRVFGFPARGPILGVRGPILGSRGRFWGSVGDPPRTRKIGVWSRIRGVRVGAGGREAGGPPEGPREPPVSAGQAVGGPYCARPASPAFWGPAAPAKVSRQHQGTLPAPREPSLARSEKRVDPGPVPESIVERYCWSILTDGGGE